MESVSPPQCEKSVLFNAKAFLCWDLFPRLVIQLIPIQKAVGYFYPAGDDRPTLFLFYQEKTDNFLEPGCLLFHEAGHYRILIKEKKRNQEPGLKLVTEARAWHAGFLLFRCFLRKQYPGHLTYLDFYRTLSERYLESYRCLER